MLSVTYVIAIVVKNCDFLTRVQFSFMPIFSTITINQLANDLMLHNM